MPIISRAAPKPLPPEGPAKLLVKDVTYNKSKEKKTRFFELTLQDLATGLLMKDRLYLTANSGWKTNACCKSMGHEIPDGDYRVQIDDLINRVVYGVVVYETLADGRPLAKMKTYWRKEWAIAQEPRLGDIPDPKGILGPVKLPAVEAVVPPDDEPPPAAQAAPVNPTPAPTPAPATRWLPEEMTEEEFEQAVAYAKLLRAQKEATPKS
jgi:hypothetical protein